VNQATTEDTSFISMGDLWKYYISKHIPDSDWTSLDYDDSSWESGHAQLGYGDGDETTVVGFGGNGSEKFITTWFRKKFTLEKASRVSGCSINILRDDGLILFLNGKELIRDNMPGGPVDSYTTAMVGISGTDESTYKSFTVNPELLRNGENLIAVEIHQTSKTSSDISFDLELVASNFPSGTGVIAFEDSLELVLSNYSQVKAVVVPVIDPADKIYINEVMADNKTVFSDEFNEYDDWIELYNSGDIPIDIGGSFITDNLDNPFKFRISSESPDSTTILPRDYLILWADNSEDQGIYHLNFMLSQTGESIGLFDPYGKLIDSISIPFISPNQSWGRLQDGDPNWGKFHYPTPKLPNLYTSVEDLSKNATPFKIYPNPASDLAYLEVFSREPGTVKIEIIESMGKLVSRWTDYHTGSGPETFEWNLANVSGQKVTSGIYYCRIQTSSGISVMKIMVQF